MIVGIIGGTGIDEMECFTSGRSVDINTSFGETSVIECMIGSCNVIFVHRHGRNHSIPPAQINYRAQIAALKKHGVERVIGVCAVGSLKTDLPNESFAVLADFIDLTKHRQYTFVDNPNGPAVHTDFTQPYCPGISNSLIQACTEQKVVYEQSATYVGVDGPRYESPAEIRLYSSWGAHVIGMTNIPEVILAREAGLCYGALAVVTNLAAGLSPTPLSHDEVRAGVHVIGDELWAILTRSVELSAQYERVCNCDTNAKYQL